MSGIVAVYSEDSDKFLQTTKIMLKKLRHRGNGKQSLYKLNKAILGKNLVKEAAMPKFEKEGSTAVIADGNILDEQDIPPEETIIKNYKEEGEEFVNNLDGPFAFVLSDGEKLMAARDPVGLKPLYYTQKDKSIMFASEIKALLGNSKKIKVFPPGYYFRSDKGFVQYNDITKIDVNKKITSTEAIKNVRKKIIEAVEKRYKANQNIGVFLSGGVDSSVIAVCCKELSVSLDTFSVGVEGSSDLQKARKVADYIGSRHHEYIFDKQDMIRILPEVIYHLESFDMFLVRSAVVNYLLSKMASYEGMEAIYCGEGADEIFAGYEYLKNLEPDEVNNELKRLTRFSHKNCFQRVDRMLKAFSMEPRLPFADNSIIEYALKLPVDFKLHNEQGDIVEKWVLRVAFIEDLPEEIIWRKKQKFFEGAGSSHYLAEYAEENISDEQFYKERKIDKNFTLRSKEELMYYKIFHEFFPYKSVLETIGRTPTKNINHK